MTPIVTRQESMIVEFSESCSPSNSEKKLTIRNLPREVNPTPQSPRDKIWHRHATNSPDKRQRPTASNDVASPRKSMMQDDGLGSNNPFDDLTESYLRDISKSHELRKVTDIKLSLDTTRQSVEMIGDMLPSLLRLELHQSSIHSLRDFGCSLRLLVVLRAEKCGIRDLDGISAFASLQQLYLKKNKIDDISHLATHEALQVIDLQDNEIFEISQVQQLALCPQLTKLVLLGNHICTETHYRQAVANFLPQVSFLDDKELTNKDRKALSYDVLDAIYTQEKSARKDDDDTRLRLSKGLQGMKGSKGYTMPKLTLDIAEASRGYGSKLTHGTDTVFAGNLTSALRRHRSDMIESSVKEPYSGSLDRDDGHLLISPTKDIPNIYTPSLVKDSMPRPKSALRRESITETLDLAHELDRRQRGPSDCPMMTELSAWQHHDSDEKTLFVPKQSRDEARTPKKSNSAGVSRNTDREAYYKNFNVKEPQKASDRLSDRPSSVVQTISSLDIKGRPKENFNAIKKLGIHRSSLDQIISAFEGQCSGTNVSTKSCAGKESADDGSDEELEDEAMFTQSKLHRSNSSKNPYSGIAAGLQAIDKWSSLEPEEHKEEEFCPTKYGNTSRIVDKNETVSMTQSLSCEKGRACFESDDHIVALLKNSERDATELKTREGFRSYFKGMDSKRLEFILSAAFSDPRKVSRRMSLMKDTTGARQNSQP